MYIAWQTAQYNFDFHQTIFFKMFCSDPRVHSRPPLALGLDKPVFHPTHQCKILLFFTVKYAWRRLCLDSSVDISDAQIINLISVTYNIVYTINVTCS